MKTDILEENECMRNLLLFNHQELLKHLSTDYNNALIVL
jgi:hypothetical protein